MPTYVYECAKCGEELEAWQSFSDEPLKKHAGCGGKLVKVLQPVGIVFKGSGFHRTDSRNGATRSRADDSADTKDSTSDKSEKAEKSDTSDTKAKTKADSSPDPSASNGSKKPSPSPQSSGSKETSSSSSNSSSK